MVSEIKVDDLTLKQRVMALEMAMEYLLKNIRPDALYSTTASETFKRLYKLEEQGDE
jgi:hypothetical protein